MVFVVLEGFEYVFLVLGVVVGGFGLVFIVVVLVVYVDYVVDVGVVV